MMKMSQINQRKKGWWKIWIILAIIVGLITIGIVLYYLGYDYISWVGTYLINFKMWGATGWMYAGFESLIWVALGIGLSYLYYWYLKGQTVKNVNTGTGYNPVPTTPSQSNSGTDTVIS
jgi:hypothetical protein